MSDLKLMICEAIHHTRFSNLYYTIEPFSNTYHNSFVDFIFIHGNTLCNWQGNWGLWLHIFGSNSIREGVLGKLIVD